MPLFIFIIVCRGKEIIKARLANGEQFCYIFRWIDELLEFDGQAARSCNGVCYRSLLIGFHAVFRITRIFS